MGYHPASPTAPNAIFLDIRLSETNMHTKRKDVNLEFEGLSKYSSGYNPQP